MSLSRVTLDRLLTTTGTGGAVLDIGCNDGGLLAELARSRPDLRLAGLDLDAEAVAQARARLPEADLRTGSVAELPFADATFDLVTCMDVLEHLPEDLRAPALEEARRVLRPNGHLVIETPHQGTFQVLDAQNLRHRFPALYRRALGRGVRDAAYADRQEVVWHQHFTRDELLALAGDGWTLTDEAYPGLAVFPLADLLSWPFNRARRRDHPVARALQRAGEWDSARDYGPRHGYEIVLTLQRAA
jgi:SAM-dependent methyltransferase